ncbi:pentapeptide repeat-containing protein [Aurantimonas coralicida]|uniref:pentapeptide repeat-containing protein n=1 Tax=Aurantimonas coralicida TaxID=182270 RepID=UPI001D198755|nr:pentapeptide repeat-containing protein [Aurantimonas coralicida]MCC4296635.1 pentapeptide repeat-containing protein [Aurantimonas coralicida]
MKQWLFAALLVTLVAVLIAGILFYHYDDLTSYWQGLAVESAGVVLEAILLVVIFGLYERVRTGREEVRRLRERVSDFKRVDDPHARAIIASSVRQLVEQGHTDIDFRGAQLSDFSFCREDIATLKGAVFSSGLNYSKPSKAFTSLTNVDFQYVDCRTVKFGAGNLALAKYVGCRFWGTDLSGAEFDGATLRWAAEAVLADEVDWKQLDDEVDGVPVYADVYLPAFEGADLRKTSFRGSRLDHADFRGAKNVTEADFTGAHGIETCFFDDGVREAIQAKPTS